MIRGMVIRADRKSVDEEEKIRCEPGTRLSWQVSDYHKQRENENGREGRPGLS